MRKDMHPRDQYIKLAQAVDMELFKALTSYDGGSNARPLIRL